MNIQDKCFNKAVLLVEKGLIELNEDMDIFQLTELLIKLESEKEYKNKKTDNLIDYNDEIVEITDMGVLDTVDISVSGDNLFYCNDILTKNSFALPMTADYMFALVTNEELEALNQYMVIQLKSRYGNVNYYKRFMVGVDKGKQRLYDVETNAQNISDKGKVEEDDIPINSFGNRERNFEKNFSGLKV